MSECENLGKVSSISLLKNLVTAYEREVGPADNWQDTAMTEAEFAEATFEYRAAKEFLSTNG